MEEPKNKYILLADLGGQKKLGTFAFSKALAHGLLWDGRPTQLLRGELLEALPEVEQPTDLNRIALVGIEDKSLRLNCPIADLARLSDEEASLLLAISSVGERYQTFNDRKRLEFGRLLSPEDQVFVAVAVKGFTKDLPGVVWYKGKLPSWPGTIFGVELTMHPGQGTCDGTFRNKRYFTCPPYSGVFVGLDKLRPQEDPDSKSPKRDENAEAKSRLTAPVNLQRQLKEMKQQLRGKHEQERNLQRHLRELEQQLRDKHEQEENFQRQLREMEQQLREKGEQEENFQRQLREMEQQLREKGEQEENFQRQLREMEQQLREKDEQEENFQRQLREMEQQLTNLQDQYREKEDETVNLQEQVNELEITLSTARQTLSEQVTPDWVISCDEIQLTGKLLGKGGWGSVVEGKYCGCAVAVKQIHELILSPHNRNLFEREMDIASRCRHPCLLQFIGATTDEGSPLFVTELMESSLRALLGQRPLATTEVSIISLDVARALNYLHQKKPSPIIHRDISSANVLLWRQGDQWRGKVSDYGTANFMQHTMTVGPGAAIYMAPEALTSNQTVKVDVYSFGVLLCEMCIRELPDPGRRDQQIAMVPNRLLRALIRRCLQSEPAVRPNMEEIIEELEKPV